MYVVLRIPYDINALCSAICTMCCDLESQMRSQCMPVIVQTSQMQKLMKWRTNSEASVPFSSSQLFLSKVHPWWTLIPWRPETHSLLKRKLALKLWRWNGSVKYQIVDAGKLLWLGSQPSISNLVNLAIGWAGNNQYSHYLKTTTIVLAPLEEAILGEWTLMICNKRSIKAWRVPSCSLDSNKTKLCKE